MFFFFCCCCSFLSLSLRLCMCLILELTVKFIDTQPQYRDIYLKCNWQSMQPNHVDRMNVCTTNAPTQLDQLTLFNFNRDNKRIQMKKKSQRRKVEIEQQHRKITENGVLPLPFFL